MMRLVLRLFLVVTMVLAAAEPARADTLQPWASCSFCEPMGVAVDREGSLWVGNYFLGTVLKFAADGSYITAVEGLLSPMGLAFDGSGNLFIADQAAGGIWEVPAGNLPQGPVPFTPFSPSGLAITLPNFDSAGGIAFDASGNLFVADSSANQVLEYQPGNAGPITVGSTGGDPEGIAFDRSGDLFISNYNSGTIDVIRAGQIRQAGPETPAVSETRFVTSTLAGPVGLAFDYADNLYIVNHLGGQTISQVPASELIAASAVPSTFISDTGSNPGPQFLVIRPSDQKMFVPNWNNATIVTDQLPLPPPPPVPTLSQGALLSFFLAVGLCGRARLRRRRAE